MARFYRVHSRLPLTKPTLSIEVHFGTGPHAPSAPASTEYHVNYSTPTRSLKRVEKEARARRKTFPFGVHTIQELEIAEGMVVNTTAGVVVTKPTPPPREKPDPAAGLIDFLLEQQKNRRQ